MEKFEKHLKSIGYTPKSKLIEFWFNNEDECVRKLNSISPNWGNTISCKLRWKTSLGLVLEEAVKDYIEKQQEIARTRSSELFKKNNYKFVWADINFNELNITINKKTEHINYWLYQITTKAGTYQNWTDLRGIDLSNIKIHSAKLSNALLSDVNFSNSTLNQLIIENCNFPNCCFKNSFIGGIQLKDVGFSNSDFTGAKLNAIKLGGEVSLGRRPKIKKISYLNLLLAAIKCKRPNHKNKHTDFSMITIYHGNDGPAIPREGLNYAIA